MIDFFNLILHFSYAIETVQRPYIRPNRKHVTWSLSKNHHKRGNQKFEELKSTVFGASLFHR